MPKKVAFLLFSNLSLGSGVEQVVLQYCRNKPSDWDVTIFQADNPTGPFVGYGDELDANNVSVVTFKAYDMKFGFLTRSVVGTFLLWTVIWRLLFVLLRTFPSYKTLRRKLRGFDIVYVFGNRYSSIVPRGPVVIGCTHAWLPRRAPESSFLESFSTWLVTRRILWRRVDVYQLFPQYAWVGKKLNRYFILGNGIDSEFLQEIKGTPKDSAARFAFLGRLEETKGVRKVIEAFRQLPYSKGCQLSIIGSGPLSGTLPDAPNVTYYGYVERKKVPWVLSKSNCFVYPTEYETFGLVILEAIASGLYVITSNSLRGTFDEFEGIGVLEYCSNDVGEIVERMERFSQRKVDSEGFKKAKQLILDSYNWDFIVPRLFKEFEKLLSPKPLL